MLRQVFLVDYKHCCFAKIYNDFSFDIVFEKTSRVSGKQRQGGQSAHRFERGRKEVVKQWFKKIDELLLKTNEEIYVGCSGVYYNHFYDCLSASNQLRIVERFDSEYSDASGIYQEVNKMKARMV